MEAMTPLALKSLPNQKGPLALTASKKWFWENPKGLEDLGQKPNFKLKLGTSYLRNNNNNWGQFLK